MGRKYTEAQARASAKWEQKHIRRVLLKFHDERDADIWEKLSQQESKQKYIKELIRKDLT